MKTPIVAITLCGVLLSASVFAQEATTKPKEIDILGQYLGNWTSEVTNKPAVWDQKGTKYTTFNHAEMILDGWFLQHIEVSHIAGEPDKVTKSLFLWTFDPNTKKYVGWPFQSTGITGSSTGEWNPITKTLTTSPVEPPLNTTSKMTEQFLDAKTIKGNLMYIEGGGKTLMDMVWTRNRQPEDAAKATCEEWGKIGKPIQPLPAELKKLQPLIGEWDSEFINGPSVQSPKGSTSKGKMTGKWILDGRFLFGTSEVGTHRSIWLIGYDTAKEAYRYVRFTNAGLIDESVGKWSDETHSFIWKVVNERPGITRTSTNQIIGQDTVLANIVAKDETGKVHQDLKIKSTRRK